MIKRYDRCICSHTAERHKASNAGTHISFSHCLECTCPYFVRTKTKTAKPGHRRSGNDSGFKRTP
jgi:hypothetical protein